MANCYNDCIHSFVCQYVNHDEYPSVQQLKDDCRYCNIGTDVVPKSEEGAECPTCHGTGRIGTTDWLTKNISKEQLAKEKAEAIAEHELRIKQDYAREIFEEIDKIFVDYKIDRCLEKCGLRLMVSNGEGIEQRFAELKKKYTEGESNGSKQ